MMELSQFITFASSRVHWRESLWINVFKTIFIKPRKSSWTSSVTNVKRSSLKWENYFFAVPSPMALSPYTAQMCMVASAAFAPLFNSSVHNSTPYLQTIQLQYVNWSITIELKKNDNRARWLRGNARDSHSGGPGFKSRCRPTWLTFFRGFPQSSRQMLGWIFITTIHLTIIHQIHIS